MTEIELQNEATWPEELLKLIGEHAHLFVDREQYTSDTSTKNWDYMPYEAAVAEISHLIQAYSIVGFHCSRLTHLEMDTIQRHGMSLQNEGTLVERIQRLVSEGALSPELGKALSTRNEVNHPNRQNMIWFTFHLPDLQCEYGVGRFFTSWGGEALYNAHESDAFTGPALRRIGHPVLIEAAVPISQLNKKDLREKLARRHLKRIGVIKEGAIDHEDFTTTALGPDCIRRLIVYPERDFLELTRCEDWIDCSFATLPNNSRSNA